MASLLLQALTIIRSTVPNKSILPSLTSIAQHAIVQKLNKIQVGQLLLICPDGQERRFGILSCPLVELRVRSEDFWTHVLLYADIVCPS